MPSRRDTSPRRVSARGFAYTLCRRGMEVQTLVFLRGFAPRDAVRWARSHGFRVEKVDFVASTGSTRIRQRNPDNFVPGSFRTIMLDEHRGVRAVVACPRAGRESDRRDRRNSSRPPVTARDPARKRRRTRRGTRRASR